MFIFNNGFYSRPQLMRKQNHPAAPVDVSLRKQVIELLSSAIGNNTCTVNTIHISNDQSSYYLYNSIKTDKVVSL
jgi:hypothetical protein